jgi:hypothetical protein
MIITIELRYESSLVTTLTTKITNYEVIYVGSGVLVGLAEMYDTFYFQLSNTSIWAMAEMSNNWDQDVITK